MLDSELLARLRLIRSENVGPVSYRQLIGRFRTAEAALQALPDLAARGGKRRIAICPPDAAAAEREAIAKAGAQLLVLGLAPYPPLLAQIDDAPPLLIARGQLALFDRPSVGIVGARNASAAGQRLAREWGQALAQQAVAVISGLARGIDGAAHAGALSAGPARVGSGGTIAVVAGGIDVHYPPEHADLQTRIAAEGLLLGEQPLGTVPQARHFPRRNRIISGLSQAVVVVEAAPRSGSLITARLAGEQGREVLAVPGSPLDARARGTNQLIREGATLVQSAEDIMEAVQPPAGLRFEEPDSGFGAGPPPEPRPQDRQQVLDLLSLAATPVDEIVRLSGLSPAMVQMALLELELAGRLTRHAGAKVSLSGGE